MKLVQKQAACTSVNISHPSSVLTRVTTATRNQEGFQWSDYTVSRHTPTRVVTHADTRSVRSPPLSAFVSLWHAEEEKMIARIFHDCSHFVFHEDTNEEKEAEQERRRVLSAIRSWAVWRVLKLERRGGAPLTVTSKPWKSTCEQPVIKARREAQQSRLESQPITSETR